MNRLHLEIAKLFGQGNAPSRDDLVSWDGFDQLDKEAAVTFYAGRSWTDVLEYLRTHRAAQYLEEWAVLKSEARAYYLRAYLEYLVEVFKTEQPDEEFVYFFLGELYQVIHMHQRSPFDVQQTGLLEEIALYLTEDSLHPDRYEYYGQDVRDQAAMFLAELHAYAG